MGDVDRFIKIIQTWCLPSRKSERDRMQEQKWERAIAECYWDRERVVDVNVIYLTKSEN